MSLLEAVVLAILQGITEFLPISSSAHLILLPFFLGWEDQGLHFDIAVHAGTLVAVIAYFRRDLAAVARQGVRSLRPGGETAAIEVRLAWGIVLGTIPVGIAGLLAYDWVATMARNPILIAWTSIGFGLALWAADAWGSRSRDLRALAWRDVALVGCAQALAVIPGTSRSGVTITAGLAGGLDRPAAARFSFLLAVPVLALATGKDLYHLVEGRIPSEEWLALAVGFVVAGVVAYGVIAALLAWLRRHSLVPFAVYRIALGAVILWVAG